MPLELPPWPAFGPNRRRPEAPLTVHRAVLGKVHQAASDFRWITHTPEVQPRKLGLSALLSLGPEDIPVRTAAWRMLDAGAVAMVGYRSRAVDRSGRSGGLEKQILYWPRAGTTDGLAAGAFALLGALEGASDDIWWSSWDSYRWDEPDYYLRREPEAIGPGDLSQAVEQGLEALQAAVGDKPKLARFYGQLLAGSVARPALLDGLAEPLPPLALAALLPLAPRRRRSCRWPARCPTVATSRRA